MNSPCMIVMQIKIIKSLRNPLERRLVPSMHHITFHADPYYSDWIASDRGWCKFSGSLPTLDQRFGLSDEVFTPDVSVNISLLSFSLPLKGVHVNARAVPLLRILCLSVQLSENSWGYLCLTPSLFVLQKETTWKTSMLSMEREQLSYRLSSQKSAIPCYFPEISSPSQDLGKLMKRKKKMPRLQLSHILIIC